MKFKKRGDEIKKKIFDSGNGHILLGRNLSVEVYILLGRS
jgi:hypothetical protein